MNRRVLHLALAFAILTSWAASAEVTLDSQPPPPEAAPLSGPLPSAGPAPLSAPTLTPPAAAPRPNETIVVSAESPRWIVSAEALWLERSVGSSIPLGFTAVNDGSHGPWTQVIDGLYSDDALFPLAAGVRLQIGARIDDRSAIQASYWGLQQWSIGSAIYGDPEGETVLAQSRWLQMPVFDDFLGYTYTSRVDSAEINHRLQLNSYGPWLVDANWLWGVRYFRLSENFTLSGSDLATGVLEDLNCRTSNNLVGLQAGIQFIRGWDRFQLTTEGKIGLLANFYTQRAIDSASGPSGSPPGFQPFDLSHSGTDLAALFEVALLGTYRISPHLWIRAGYQFYCVTGLALAPRQVGSFGHGGTVGLDGLSLGLEAAW